jgi:hypothetical protein
MQTPDFDRRWQQVELMPGRKMFPAGVSHLSRFTAMECRVIGETLPFIMVGLTADCGQIVEVATLYAKWRHMLGLHPMTEVLAGDLQDLTFKLQSAMDGMDVQLGTRMTRNSVKMHHCLHWGDMIKEFGHPSNYNAETFESAHRPFVKKNAGVVSYRYPSTNLFQLLKRDLMHRIVVGTHGVPRTLNAAGSLTRGGGEKERLDHLLLRYNCGPSPDMMTAHNGNIRTKNAAWLRVPKCWIRPGHWIEWVRGFSNLVNHN